MNTNKKNSGWILCPSKTFPGKFYYFNVVNGETAWSVNEIEKKLTRKDVPIQKIDKPHCYPEPSSPPATSPTPTFKQPNVPNKTYTPNNTYQPNTPNNTYMSNPHVFGQAVFPKPLSNVECPNIVWTPIQIQLPMFITPNIKSEVRDEQVSEKELKRELFVQTTNVSLCQRFENYENPVIKFNKENKIENVHLFHTSTPKKSVASTFPNDQFSLDDISLSKMNLNKDLSEKNMQTKPLIRNPILNLTENPYNKNATKHIDRAHIFKPNLFTEPAKEKSNENIFRQGFETNLPKSILNYQNDKINHKPTKNIERVITSLQNDNINQKPTNFDKVLSTNLNDKGISTLTPSDNVDNTSDNNHLKNLNESDLRILLNKKRKSIDVGKTENIDGKKVRTVKRDNIEPVTQKKKVTFNLVPESYSDLESEEDIRYCGLDPTFNEENIAADQELKPSNSGRNYFHIVVDTNVLLEELDFLDDFVKSDPKYSLKIPSAVMSETISLSRSESRHRHRVTLARQCLRKLATPHPQITVQSSLLEDSIDNVPTDSIINCCLEEMERNSHVILITDDENLQRKAKSVKIEAYTPHHLKDGCIKKQEVYFDIKKIKISVPNETGSQNLENGVPAHVFKNKLFDKIAPEISNFIQDKKSYVITKESINASRTDWKHDSGAEKDFNLKENPILFQIQKDVMTNSTQINEIPSTLKNKISTTPNDTVSFYFRNDSSKEKHQSDVENKLYPENESKTLSFLFQNKEAQSNSIFELGTDKLKAKPYNHSIFEIDDDQPLQLKSSNFEIEKDSTSKFQTKSFMFKSDIQPQYSVFENIKPRTEDIQKRSIFENCQFQTKENKIPSIFEIEKKNESQINSIFESDNVATFETDIFKSVLPNGTNGIAIEEYLRKFYVKSRIMQERIEERREEFICSFAQVMEECLSCILQQQSSSVQNLTPPWTLYEALQCINKMYETHTSVRRIVDELCALLYDKYEDAIKPGLTTDELVKAIGCGMLLIEYLKTVINMNEVLIDAESSLNNILSNIENPISDVNDQPVKIPVLSRTDIHREVNQNRRNFVKDRSEVVTYLKKHFPAWANYEVTKENLVWGQSYKETKIVRTCGKNLSLLKLNKSRTMTMNTQNDPTNQNDLKKDISEQNVNIKQNIHIQDDNNNKTESNYFTNNNTTELNTQRNANEKCNEFKRSLVVENKSKTCQNGATTFELHKNEQDSQTVQKTAPKIIRIFDTKQLVERQKEESSNENPLDLDYALHENTFNAPNDNPGPKVVRNIQLIQAFEEKIKQTPLNLDELDYSAISDDQKSFSNDDDHVIDERNDSNKTNENDEVNNLNDHLDAANDKGFTMTEYDDTQDVDDCLYDNNSYATNNGSYAMSLDNCVNGIYGTNDDINDKEIEYTDDRNDTKVNSKNKDYLNDENVALNDNCSLNDNYASDYVSCLTNNISHGTNDQCYSINEEAYEINDFYAANDNSKGYKEMKEDSTNDSGFENESLQTYSLVKSFLCEISSTFKLVHKFIEGAIKEIRDDKLLENKKKMLNNKANATYTELSEITDNLKSIIERESAEDTYLKGMLTSAGTDAVSDKRITRYKQVVIKCLEQAQILESALKMMISVTSDNIDCLSVHTEMSNYRCINIYE